MCSGGETFPVNRKACGGSLPRCCITHRGLFVKGSFCGGVWVKGSCGGGRGEDGIGGKARIE